MFEDYDLNIFMILCERSSFPNKAEVLEISTQNAFSVRCSTGSKVPAESMLTIYRRRREHLGKMLNSDHAARLFSEVSAFVIELENNIEDKIRLWHLPVDERSSYAIFESIKAGKILGCIYGIDRRELSEFEWNELWGNNE